MKSQKVLHPNSPGGGGKNTCGPITVERQQKNELESRSCKTWFVLLFKLGLHTVLYCIFKIKRVIAIFCLSMWCAISISQNFEILKSRSNFEIWVRIFILFMAIGKFNKQKMLENLVSIKVNNALKKIWIKKKWR